MEKHWENFSWKKIIWKSSWIFESYCEVDLHFRISLAFQFYYYWLIVTIKNNIGEGFLTEAIEKWLLLLIIVEWCKARSELSSNTSNMNCSNKTCTFQKSSALLCHFLFCFQIWNCSNSLLSKTVTHGIFSINYKKWLLVDSLLILLLFLTFLRDQMVDA